MRKRAILLSTVLAAGICVTPALTVNAAPSLNPYAGIEAEVIFGSSGIETITEADGRKVVSSIEKGDYFTVKSLNLSSGLASITITAKTDGMGVIDIKKGDANGESLGNIKLKNTNGEYQTFSASLKDLVGTNETITFVGSLGNVSIDSWIATPSATDPGTEDPGTPEDPGTEDPGTTNPEPITDAYAVIEAENASAVQNATVQAADGVTYQTISQDGYIVYKNVDLSRGLAGFLTTARAGHPKTSLAIYVDSLDSAPVANITITSREFKGNAAKLTSDLTGTHDIYVVAKGHEVDLDSLQIIPAKEQTEDPGTPEDPGTEDPGTPEDPGTEDPGTPEDPGTEDPGTPEDPGTEDPGTPAEGKNVSYTINNWGSGYLVNIKVTNTSDQAISGWKVKVRKDQVNINSSWCVNIAEEGDYYVITPLEWNTNLASGQTAEFGFIGTGSVSESIDVTVE